MDVQVVRRDAVDLGERAVLLPLLEPFEDHVEAQQQGRDAEHDGRNDGPAEREPDHR
ncbi:hypothetical protein [Actinoallomurus rhizosphaericola]|uniref:hypothetical protein n=1 Tax=Actinoallomurus rhizosphaericola TaxID=2952536 RepID=UPI0020935AD1|nr:hypothetical protein [Actinoallomurus rhizosphaericola]MCO5999817.1 hypothetical protein [Actinoallomurus rhizosphaericola]